MLAATVVVPAHNEEAVLGRLLAALLPSRDSEGLHVVVVANGCTDQVAVVACSHPSVEVVELPFGNKQLAMRAGDALGGDGAVVFVDADVVISREDVLGLVEAFAEPGVLAAAPRRRLDLEGSSWLCGPTPRVEGLPPCGSVSSVEE